MLVAIPGTVVAIRRKPKQKKEFGRRLQFWHSRPFAKEVAMPARRLSMQKIREMLRLLWECELSQRQVAACCGLSTGAVAECAARACLMAGLRSPGSGCCWQGSGARPPPAPARRHHRRGRRSRQASADARRDGNAGGRPMAAPVNEAGAGRKPVCI